jgi:dihydrofolate reductase
MIGRQARSRAPLRQVQHSEVGLGKVAYLMNVSLDGYVETTDHSLDWTTVDDELHTWFNARQRETAVSVYGRRLWETMAGYWPTGETNPESTEAMREFARFWNATPKVVFSRERESVEHGARLVRGDVGEELAKLQQEFDGEIAVGGPTLRLIDSRAFASGAMYLGYEVVR